MSRGRFFTRRSTSDSVRVGALSLSVAVHLAALTVLGSVHFRRDAVAPAEAVSADISVHVVERILEAPPSPKPKPRIEPTPAPTVAPPLPKPAEPEPVTPPPAPKQEPSQPVVSKMDSRPADTVFFSGTTVAAKRVCYVVDGSGSMFGLMYLVREQLRESILKLSAEQSFNVVFFMENGQLLQAFEGTLEKASPSAKAEALNLLGRIRPGGQTIAEDALAAAMRMSDKSGRRAEVLYFVTDGFDLMDGDGRAFIRRIEALRQSVSPGTVVHTIGIYPEARDSGILSRLAQVCGGRYIEVN